MKSTSWFIMIMLSLAIVFSGCKSMSKTAKGGLLGGGAGAAIGAGVGILIGKDAKSAAIGAGIGTAVGATTGAIIGRKMDKAAAEAARIEGARVDSIRDMNNLKALRVTFDTGILFQTGKSVLNTDSRQSLTKFSKILKENPSMDISIVGHTDTQGSLELNERLSRERAQAVSDFLATQNVMSSQVKEVIGRNYSDPVADNSTAAGRAANRRVEVYMYASPEMIKEAQQQAK